MVFTLRAPVTLTFDLLTPKSIGFFYLIKAITLLSLNDLGQAVLELLTRYGFHSSGPVTLTFDPKINRSPVLNKDIHHMKFAGSGCNRIPIIERKRFSLFGPLWPWRLAYWPPKSIGFFYSIRAIILWSLNALGQRVLEILSRNGFHSSGPCDLDLWPTDPKINKVLLLNKGYHPMKFECSGSNGTPVIEWKPSVTDGQMDRANKIMSPPQGGALQRIWGDTGFDPRSH